MSDINSKKDNSTKIGDYGKKLGLSILKFCILILIGCLILYASKSCGSGVLDIIIPTYYIEGLTDTLLFKPNECSENERSGEEYEQQEQFLNTQYINRVKGDDNQSLYQELNFSYNSENQESVWTSLNDKLKIIRDQMRDKTIGDKNPTKKKISFFELFVTGIISNVSIFNLTFLNSYFKFLNNKFSDSATIIFGPFISMIILLIIAMMTMCVTVYYILYNVQWLVLNTAADIYDPSDLKISTHNSQLFINGAPIFYTPSKNLLVFPWLFWLGWCTIIGYAVAIAIFPISIGLTVYNLLKWLLFILFLPSTCNDNKPCNFFTMFVDSFKYKRPLISWIMSLIVISTSFDVFDTAGGSIAIIVFLLVFFNFIKIGLFDKYVPTDIEMTTFVPMDKFEDILPKCITKYEDAQPTKAPQKAVQKAVYNADTGAGTSAAADTSAADTGKPVDTAADTGTSAADTGKSVDTDTGTSAAADTSKPVDTGITAAVAKAKEVLTSAAADIGITAAVAKAKEEFTTAATDKANETLTTGTAAATNMAETLAKRSPTGIAATTALSMAKSASGKEPLSGLPISQISQISQNLTQSQKK